MKKLLLLLIAGCLLSFTACKVNLGTGENRIDPSGNIVKAKYPQEAFDKVDNHVVGNIQLVQSSQSRVTLSAPDNYIDLFEFKNEDGELTINFKEDNISIDTKDVVIVIYTPSISKVKNSGAADIRLDSLTTDELEVSNSGVGAFNLGHIKAREIDVSCSGVGSITISGQTDEAEYSCSGVGSIKGDGLKAKSVKADVSGVGGIRCYASERIDGRVSGVGSLKYGGNPQEKQLKRDGVGGISEI
jgi:hypothetical protein